MTDLPGAYALSNVVEIALAWALVLAAKAKRWDVVVLIAESSGDDANQAPITYFFGDASAELGLMVA